MNRPTNRRHLPTMCAYLASAVIVASIATSAVAQDDALMANAFAAEVDEDLFIGVLVADDPDAPERTALIVYLCDGADVSTWLFADTTDGFAVLETSDTRVEVLLGQGSVDGVVESMGGAPQTFVAPLVTGDAGLFRGVQTFDGREYVGGWIVLEDGRQRGALTLDGDVVENPPFDPDTGESQTSLGAFGTNCFINPRTGEKVCRYLN